MPNPYFKFKQFTVYHDRCAMKVGTDGVLLGAWADIAKAKDALDIGTGSGLISLMLAQRNTTMRVKAIDIESEAIAQARYNIEHSPFAGRVDCEHVSMQEFVKSHAKKYDLIVSNPPFFNKSLRSPNEQRTLARHTDTLPMEELVALSALLLTEQGRLALIYPYEYRDKLTEATYNNSLYIRRLTNVFPTPSSLPKRILAELTTIKEETIEDELIIETERHVYSESFTKLVKDFYLRM